MQPKHLSIIALAVLALGAGALLWQVMRDPGKGDPGGPGNTAAEVQEAPFDYANFYSDFDENRDGGVTLDEFRAGYAKWEGRYRFNRGPRQPALGADDAFAWLDHNNDGKINDGDMRLAADLGWLKFQKDCIAQGLHAREWKGTWLKLNDGQARTFSAEVGADARNELPYGGAFFSRKYFEGRRFVSVKDAKGDVTRGFATLDSMGTPDKKDDRLKLVTDDARLMAFDPARVEIVDQPAAPQVEYLTAVETTQFNDPVANLKLARRCAELGLKREAGMMFCRVLVFDRANAEALAALGLKLKGDQYEAK